MKKMKTTIATVVALSACVSTQLFAQNVKEDTITFALTGIQQVSVSTSATVPNAGNWTDGPKYYKTAPVKVTDKDIIKYIGAVLWRNASHYSSSAKLVLVQGELSGFFNITPDLAGSTANTFGGTTWPDGTFASADTDASTALANSFDSTYVALANGRHWDVNPLDGTLFPVGHLQPWGQIYVKDPVKGNDNVTYFFAISVEECYDCFYLNSFVSDAAFTTKIGAQNGPPCCGTASTLVGKGKDRYYVTLSFDNSENNPYLNDLNSSCYVGVDVGIGNIIGFATTTIPGDAIVPDSIDYVNAIRSRVGAPAPYEARFTLNGVLTYTWNLNFVDKQDLSPDFVGTGSYVANGYGFIALSCTLFSSATVNFTEKVVRAGTTVTGEDWANSWYGVGAEYVTAETASGYETAYEAGFYPTPINVSTSLSYHENFNVVYPNNNGPNLFPASWPSPGYVSPLFW